MFFSLLLFLLPVGHRRVFDICVEMPIVEDQISQTSSSDDGYYYRKSKPFVKNPSKIFVGGLPYSTSDG